MIKNALSFILSAAIKVVLALVVIVITALGVTPALIWHAFTGSSRYWRIMVGLDCADSALFGGDGHTTISKRAYLASLRGDRWGCVLCKLLDRVDAGHCKRAAGN
jgi:hypothetical protein